MRSLIYALGLFFLQLVPFHSLVVQDIDNNEMNFSGLEGKKVLIVNVATNSADSSQLGQLETLYQLYQDKLVIIAVPSNDFGNEPLDEVAIKTMLQAKYNIHYLLTQKLAVKDSAISPLYQWLTQKSRNGKTDTRVGKDFYKYLISGGGQVIGVFSEKILPTDDAIQNAIK